MKKLIPNNAVLVPDNAERVFKGMIFDVYQWPQKLYDGSEHTFEMLKRADTVHSICIVNEKVLMLDDEQPHLGRKKTFPGGRVDPGDSSTLNAVKREVQEETGYSFKGWQLVKVSQPFSKIEWFTYLYLAWEVDKKTETHHDAGEKIKLTELSLPEVKELVSQHEGHLGESAPLFENVNLLDDLLGLPEFRGREVDR